MCRGPHDATMPGGTRTTVWHPSAAMTCSHARLGFLLLALLLAGCPDDGGTLPTDDDDSVADDDDATGDDDDSTPQPTNPRPVTVDTSDGVALRGTFQAAPGVDEGPGVLLVHELYGDTGDFVTVWNNFLNQGIAVLAVDLRGHGNSPDVAGSIDDLRTDPALLPLDVQAALQFLADEDTVDPNRLGLLGLDVGANLTLLAAHEGWGVAAYVAVSPDLAGVEALSGTTLDALQLSAGGQFVAGTTDDASAADTEDLYDVAAEPKDLRIVLGTGAHGAALVSGSPDAQSGVVAWLAGQLDDDE